MHAQELVGILTLGAWTLALAQPADVLVGTWEVDPTATEQIMHSPPLFRKVVFAKTGTSLREQVFRTTSIEGESATSVVYTLDGRSERAEVGGVAVSTTATWKANKLVIVWRDPEGSLLQQVITAAPDRSSIRVELSNEEQYDRPHQVLILRRSKPR
jgi:hypothetical protein